MRVHRRAYPLSFFFIMAGPGAQLGLDLESVYLAARAAQNTRLLIAR